METDYFYLIFLCKIFQIQRSISFENCLVLVHTFEFAQISEKRERNSNRKFFWCLTMQFSHNVGYGFVSEFCEEFYEL